MSTRGVAGAVSHAVRQALGTVLERSVALERAPRRAGRFVVGVTTLRTAPLTAEVWYPAAADAREVKQLYGRIYLGFAARDAVPRAMSCPLVVLSHGLRSNRYDLSWLAEGLAADGYVAVAVEHPAEPDATLPSAITNPREEPAIKLWERAALLRHGIDAVLAHARFGPHIDPTTIIVAGHSAGGSTALVLGGARVNRALFAQRFPSASAHETMPDDLRCHDARVRAVVALAPGTGPIFDAAGIAAVNVPVLIVSGTDDVETPDDVCAAHFAKHLRQVQWHSIAHAGHYTFKPQCNWVGRLRLPAISRDHVSIDRAGVHQQILAWTRDFISKNLPTPRA